MQSISPILVNFAFHSRQILKIFVIKATIGAFAQTLFEKKYFAWLNKYQCWWSGATYVYYYVYDTIVYIFQTIFFYQIHVIWSKIDDLEQLSIFKTIYFVV